ncbi:MAG: UbiA family prenyltransferase, partial [Dinghuibacter sp.]|nr:UbiA family prenyltransferase [Dinghuibacter sp.]
MIETLPGNASVKLPVNPVLVLWRFSRPHTIIGSVFSITALYILAGKGALSVSTVYFLTLLSALACNIFIVGLNQWVDVELDKVNKPELPLAAGTLSKPQARIILTVSLLVCLVVSALVSWFLLAMMVVILLIGIAYSVPPVQLKKHHLPAALSITLVRGFIVNLGMFIHFQREQFGSSF